MLGAFRRRTRSGGPRSPRRRRAGCLLWIVVLILALVILSLMFGGFQKGTKAGGDGGPAPVPVAAAPGSGP